MKSAAVPSPTQASIESQSAAIVRSVDPGEPPNGSTIRVRRFPAGPFAVASLLMSVLALACSESPVAPDGSDAPQFVVGDHGVIQHLTVGSNDLCPALGLAPGCDANFSLVANRWADGTVRGQWQDGFGKGSNGEQLGGVHVSIDCLEIIELPIGIYTFTVAWVSGIVTKSSSPSFSVGEGVITLAVDRGTSANDLFEDLGSLTLPLSSFPAGTTCADMPDLPVFLGVSFTGQVDIWFK